MILYINCCVREASRTDRLARRVLELLGGEVKELRLYEEDLRPLDRGTLKRRTALIEQGSYGDRMFEYAKQFAAADSIVIAAPYWDLSFPAPLKVYFENIYVTGIVSEYTEEGVPRGLCRAKRLIYVTTAGGPYDPTYSYGYVKSLAEDFFGIPEVSLVKAEMLDIVGNDAEEILRKAMDDVVLRTYRFYGWETATVKDKNGLTPRDYYDLLAGIWSADTCAPRMRHEWSPANITRGQCSITAFLIQDLYGGKVLGVPLKDGNYHCFNVVGNCVFDLTSEQFGDVKLDYTDCPEQSREVHFAKEEKRQRYELLKEKLRESIAEKLSLS